ncbi:MAG TPA: hypothetical protein VFM72_06440 [Aequorivita sp.]|nr:hypothetical protein [Aequorivita sp.]
MKQTLLNNLKNIPGWNTKRKIVVIAVDDYGNVRLDSKEARENMDKAGLKIHSRFDAFDTLETRQDIEGLYEVLTSVKDKNGRHAVFTPYALPCNIDFEKMADNDYKKYSYELLPETYGKLSAKSPNAYNGAWSLWQEGIEKGLMKPQFHGREHLNLKVFDKKLKERDHEVMTALRNRSYTSLSNSGFPNTRFTAAFDFEKKKDLEDFPKILKSGLEAFETVYGFKSDTFTPPAQGFHESLLPVIKQKGVKAINRSLYETKHLGDGRYKKGINFTGYKKSKGIVYLVRNVVFEPTEDRGTDWVQNTFDQIGVAFRWNRPALISSHRVNFCGHIDENNRKKGLTALKQLLDKIVKEWPDVEFMGMDELVGIMLNQRNN